MKTLLRTIHLVLVPENDGEQAELASWSGNYADHVFGATPNAGRGFALVALGKRADACREPINVTGTSRDPISLIANFAPTPFELDGMRYSCVEAFWQSLRFPPEHRARIAVLDGAAAKRASTQQPYPAFISYADQSVPVGTYDHWQLMRLACRAKFAQNADARAALLDTNERPLTHRVRRDSRTIPGVIMADIWMRIRSELRRELTTVGHQF
ncbi:MAG: hypothetical protein QOJ86_1336 [Bradyrhizobium sp.]|jgi:predicted NAD-dependent protein-ADP-ribosyltransferase YbiA (DUF1768 family)|nr:hypothetical protein [Bradyrhizobium sp.]